MKKKTTKTKKTSMPADQEKFLKEAFDKVDKKRTGSINDTGLMDIMKNLGNPINKKQAANLIKTVSSSGDLTFDDYLTLMSNQLESIEIETTTISKTAQKSGSKQTERKEVVERTVSEGVMKGLRFEMIRPDVTSITTDLVQQKIGENVYDAAEAQNWCNDITNELSKTFGEQFKGFKFVVVTNLYEKGYASLHYVPAVWWDPITDGAVSVKQENDSMVCFVTVFGVVQ